MYLQEGTDQGIHLQGSQGECNVEATQMMMPSSCNKCILLDAVHLLIVQHSKKL